MNISHIVPKQFNVRHHHLANDRAASKLSVEIRETVMADMPVILSFNEETERSQAVSFAKEFSKFVFIRQNKQSLKIHLSYYSAAVELEEDIRTCDIEKFVCLDQYGVVFSAEGDNRSINFSDQELRTLREIQTLELNGKGIHNHPSLHGLDYPPSFRDLYTSIMCSFDESRIVCPNGSFVVQPSDSISKWGHGFANEFQKKYANIRERRIKDFSAVFGKTAELYTEELSQVELQTEVLLELLKEFPQISVTFICKHGITRVEPGS